MPAPLMTAPWWGEHLRLEHVPAGVRVMRDETCLRVRTRLPGRGPALWTTTLIGGLAALVLACTLPTHPTTLVLHILWWVMASVSALIVAVTVPLFVALARAHRLLVLNPGVLLLSEYQGMRDIGVTCMRANLQSVALQPEEDASLAYLVMEMEISPTQQRILKLESDSDETMLAVAHCCHDERREVARFLGRLIADWAQMHLYEPGDRASSSQISIPRA